MATLQAGALWRVATVRMPTKWGMFDAIGFERDVSDDSRQAETALAIVMGDVTQGAPLLRIHSQCFTGEALGSLRCDCGDQLSIAMQAIAEEGRGLVIYDYQEGRGIGLMSKLQAYELQDAGLDTIEANYALGFKSDCRDFSLAVEILRDLSVGRVRLLTNNPQKVRAVSDAGVEIVARIPCEAGATAHSVGYLRTKKEKMGHALSLRPYDRPERKTNPRASGRPRLKELVPATRIFGSPGRDRHRTIDVTRRARGIEVQL